MRLSTSITYEMRKKMLLLLGLICCAWGLQATTSAYNTTSHSIMNAGDFAKPGCQSQCGNLKVPYPFGIQSQGQDDPTCSINYEFEIICDNSSNPPKAFIKIWNNIEIFDISDNELRVSNVVAESCYDESGSYRNNSVTTELDGTTYTFSSANVLTVVGCDDYVDIFKGSSLPKGCGTTCQSEEEIDKDGCFGTGCCQVSINVLDFYIIFLHSYQNHTTNNIASFNPCSYGFLGEKNSFDFSLLSNLKDAALKDKILDTVPIVLDWVIDKNNTCAQAAQDSDTFACKYANSYCVDAGIRSGGYRCSCQQGYEGNPYLSQGCTDIDECADPTKNDCQKTCINIPGDYNCSCPPDYDGDGRKSGSGCAARKSSKFPLIKFILGNKEFLS